MGMLNSYQADGASTLASLLGRMSPCLCNHLAALCFGAPRVRYQAQHVPKLHMGASSLRRMMARLQNVRLQFPAEHVSLIDGCQRHYIHRALRNSFISPAVQSFAAVIQRYMTMDQASKDGRQALITMAGKPCMREVRRQCLPGHCAH